MWFHDGLGLDDRFVGVHLAVNGLEVGTEVYLATQVERVVPGPVEEFGGDLLSRMEVRGSDHRLGVLVSGALAILALLVHGYHPYAEDGGLYVSGIKRLLDPSLYPFGGEFAQSQLRTSVFAPAVAGLVRASGVRLPVALFWLHGLSVWVTIYAVWLLATRIYGRERSARWGSVGLLAGLLGLPVAGTSLLVMDPYLTSRSFSTPCMILAMVGVLGAMGVGGERRGGGWVLCGVSLGLAMLFHPLMGAYACGAAVLLLCSLKRSPGVRLRWLAGMAALAVGVAVAVVLGAPAESGVYWRAETTRDYWFLARWEWFEWCGAVLPLGILGAVLWRGGAVRARARRAWMGTEAERGLARMAVWMGWMALGIAGGLARAGMRGHLLARMQPMRVFQVVYVVLIVVLGARLGERVLRRRAWRWGAAATVLGWAMFTAARGTYPASAQVEAPWGAGEGRNGWVRAFGWVRENTPRDAVFALPADYTTMPGEDAQGFRAIAERSVLPDVAKDGGAAAIRPALAAAWADGVEAQSGLERVGDEERRRRLLPRGVSWVVLPAGAATGFVCPYRNAEVEVCRVQ